MVDDINHGGHSEFVQVCWNQISMPIVKSPMPKLSFVWFTVLNCHRVICQTSSKVDQLQAHPANNGAGWGDHDPAPSAPLPPSASELPEQMQERESSCAHWAEQCQVQRATIPAPVSIWCNRSRSSPRVASVPWSPPHPKCSGQCLLVKNDSMLTHLIILQEMILFTKSESV